jgi:hypothetical protein
MSDPLSKSTPVLPDDMAPCFDDLVAGWLDWLTSRNICAVVHRMDVERAMQPPVIHVTVPGIPGHFTGVAGDPSVVYSVFDAPR